MSPMSEMIKEIDSLRFADYNPRIMREFDDNALGDSMTRFGDISGITNNVSSGNLVTGHQRIRKLKAKYGARVKVYIEQRNSDVDEYGTIAVGFVGVDGTSVRFAYREVMWERGIEMAANVAANHIGGDDDKDKLAQLDYELSQMDNGQELLAATGRSNKEIEKSLQSIGVGPEPELPPEEPEEKQSNKLTFAITADQKAVIQQALELVKNTREIQHTDTNDVNGAALYVLAKDYLDAHPSQPGELTDIPES